MSVRRIFLRTVRERERAMECPFVRSIVERRLLRETWKDSETHTCTKMRTGGTNFPVRCNCLRAKSFPSSFVQKRSSCSMDAAAAFGAPDNPRTRRARHGNVDLKDREEEEEEIQKMRGREKHTPCPVGKRERTRASPGASHDTEEMKKEQPTEGRLKHVGSIRCRAQKRWRKTNKSGWEYTGEGREKVGRSLLERKATGDDAGLEVFCLARS